MAQNKQQPFGRGAKYAVVPVGAVRMLNVRSDDEVVKAQGAVTDEMIAALEEMVNAARAGRLQSDAALNMGAVAW